MGCVKEGMRTAGVTEEDAQDRARWRRTILGIKSAEEEDYGYYYHSLPSCTLSTIPTLDAAQYRCKCRLIVKVI